MGKKIRMENYFRTNHNKGALRGAVQSAQGGGEGRKEPEEGRKGAGPGQAPHPFDSGARMGLCRDRRDTHPGEEGNGQQRHPTPAGRERGGRGSLRLLTAARRAIDPTGRQGKKPQSAELRPAGAASHRPGSSGGSCREAAGEEMKKAIDRKSVV